MTFKFFNIFHHRFVKDVTTVASGTAGAQILTILFAPLITRLYGPEIFGLQSIFFSLIGLLSTFAALSYPTAIVLPKNDNDAIGIAKISIMLSLVIALLTYLLLDFFGLKLLRFLNAESISDFIFLIPIAMFFSVFSTVQGQWLIRKRAYKLTAKISIFGALFINTIKSYLGYINPSAAGLIFTNIFGSLLISCVVLLRSNKSIKIEKTLASPEKKKVILKQLMVSYKDFPLYRCPQNLINSFSQSLPVLFLAAYFGSAAAGQYSIAVSLLAMPASLIGASVMSVFYPRITKAFHDGEDARQMIINATAGMALFGALPYLIVIFLGPSIFCFIFGKEWLTAGSYAQLLSAWLFLQFINKPAVCAIPILGLQRQFLVYEFFSTGSKILSLWIGFFIFKEVMISIALFSISGIFAYIFLIFWVIKKSITPNSIRD